MAHWYAEHPTEPTVEIGSVFVLENGKTRYVVKHILPDGSLRYATEQKPELSLAESEGAVINAEHAEMVKAMANKLSRDQREAILTDVMVDISRGQDLSVARNRLSILINDERAEARMD